MREIVLDETLTVLVIVSKIGNTYNKIIVYVEECEEQNVFKHCKFSKNCCQWRRTKEKSLVHWRTVVDFVHILLPHPPTPPTNGFS